MISFRDWALNAPDECRVAHVLLYISPDGLRYMAPVGTPDPDPDRPLSPLWTEIRLVKSEEES